ncbi:hypothetical protein LTS10_001191 [Elasticomyces elasticus]|nr:hypothetical protein LTS10_001191 [Elasticomyces elasticus]
MKPLVFLSISALVCAQIQSPQTLSQFRNNTSTPTPTDDWQQFHTTLAPDAVLSSIPPCCWVVAGTHAVGVGRWWTSSSAQTVATVVTNYMRNNNTTLLLNSSTIYIPANRTFLPDFQYQWESAFPPQGIPDDIITGAGARLAWEDSYAGTDFVRGTVLAFESTDLKITSPTAYNQWNSLGIFTAYPALSATISGMQTFDPTMCGSWTTPTWPECVGSYDTLTMETHRTVQDGATYTRFDREETCKSYSTSTRVPGLAPYWWDFFYLNYPNPGTPSWISSGADASRPLAAYGYSYLSKTYVVPVATQVPDGMSYLDFPPDLLKWLAQQPDIKSKYPYIESCWTYTGQGEPIAHVPVVQLTVSSTNYIEMAGVISTPSMPKPTTSAPRAAISQDSIAPATTPAKSPSSAPTVVSSSFASGLPSTVQTQEQTSPIAKAQTQTTDESTSSSPVKTSATNSLGGLFSAISSVGQQQQQQQASSADVDGSSNEGVSPTQTSGPGARTSSGLPGASTLASTPSNADSSQPAYAIGSQIASPNGPAISSEGTTYSALPLGSGLQVAGSDGTSTVLALATDGPLPYVVNGQTIHSSLATISGTIYSALPSGSGVQVLAAGTTANIRPIYASSSLVTTLPNGQVVSSIGLGSSIQPASITIGSQALHYSSIAPGEVVIGSKTLTAGGSAIVEHGQTLSLTTQSGNAALVVNGASTMTLPANVPNSATQLVTIGDQTYTAYATASSALVIDGVTVHPGGATLNNGETVSLIGTNLLVASGTATSTEGLGAAIISGLGGSQSSSSSSLEAFTGAAVKKSVSMRMSYLLMLIRLHRYLA